MAGTSKTSRKAINASSSSKGHPGQTEGASRFIPLGAGHCYLIHPVTGKTLHVKVGSEKLFDELRAVAETHGARLRAEIGELAERFPEQEHWAALAQRYDSELVQA